jgi:hypothetical protein
MFTALHSSRVLDKMSEKEEVAFTLPARTAELGEHALANSAVYWRARRVRNTRPDRHVAFRSPYWSNNLLCQLVKPS